MSSQNGLGWLYDAWGFFSRKVAGLFKGDVIVNVHLLNSSVKSSVSTVPFFFFFFKTNELCSLICTNMTFVRYYQFFGKMIEFVLSSNWYNIMELQRNEQSKKRCASLYLVYSVASFHWDINAILCHGFFRKLHQKSHFWIFTADLIRNLLSVPS